MPKAQKLTTVIKQYCTMVGDRAFRSLSHHIKNPVSLRWIVVIDVEGYGPRTYRFASSSHAFIYFNNLIIDIRDGNYRAPEQF